MNGIWLGILLLFILVVFNYLLFRDLVYPGLIQSVLWLTVLLIYAFNISQYYEVSSLVIAIIVAGCFCFTSGSYIFNWRNSFSKIRSQLSITYFPSRLWLRIFFVVSLVGLILTYKKALSLAGHGPFSNFFINLRLALNGVTDEGEGYGKLNYFLWISFFSMAVHLIGSWLANYKRSLDFLFSLSSVFIAFAIAVLHTGRTHILFALIVFLFIGLLTKKINYSFALLMLLLFMTAVFSLYSIILNKGGSFDASALENIIVLKSIVIHYIVSPLPALSALISSTNHYYFPDNILTSLSTYLNKIGFSMHEISPVRDFVDVPLPTNIYTVYDVYYLDFGLIGVLVFQFVAGLWHGFLYARILSNRVSVVYLILFVFSMYPLITQYSGDFYAIGIRAWFYILLLSLLFNMLGRFSNNKKTRSPYKPINMREFPSTNS